MIKKSEPTVIHLDLDAIQEAQILQEIEEHLIKIDQKRGDINFRDRIQKKWDMYNGVKDPSMWKPWPHAADYHIHITQTYCDTVVLRALRQTLIATPLITLSADDDIGENDIRDREDRLDFKLRNDIKIEKLLESGVYLEATLQGTSFLKVPHAKEVEYTNFVAEYMPGDIDKYEIESLVYEEKEEARKENLKKLKNNQTIYVEREEQIIKHYGPKPYRVPLENLYLYPDIKEMERQPLIAEELTFVWQDIQNRLDTNYYYEEAVEKIKGEFSKDYYKRDYSIMECILYTKIKDKFMRYIITIEPMSKTILRAIHYPYKHGQIYYIPYHIKERDDSVYGYSLGDLLLDPNKMINSAWRAAYDRMALDNKPPKQVASNQLDLQSVVYEPGAVYPVKVPDTLRILELKNRGHDTYKILAMAQLFTETSTGVSAGTMSGQVNPIDPRSPMGKTAMLLAESNIRIEKYIVNLQKATADLSYQVEALISQYSPDDLDYWKENEKQSVDRDVLLKRVRRVAHGSYLSQNKPMELQGIERFIMLVFQKFPEVVQNPEIRKMFIKVYLDMLGGQMEKKKDFIIEKLEEQEKLAAEEAAGLEAKIEMALDELTPEQQAALEVEIQEARAAGAPAGEPASAPVI